MPGDFAAETTRFCEARATHDVKNSSPLNEDLSTRVDSKGSWCIYNIIYSNVF